MGLRNWIAQKLDTAEVVVIFVALILVATLYPTIFGLMYGVNTTSWPSATSTIYYVLILVAAISVLLGFVKYATGKFHFTSYEPGVSAEAIVGIVIFFILFATLVPTGFTTLLHAFNSTAGGQPSWYAQTYGSLVVTIMQLVPTMILIGVIVAALYWFAVRQA
jgi:hypothetical protein